jgi:hypothetical protein
MASGSGVERRPNRAETAVFARESIGPGPVPDLDSADHRNDGQRPIMDLPGILDLNRPLRHFD